VGAPKVASAAAALQALNPRACIETHAVRLDMDNAVQLLAGHDLLIDGSDNFAARYAVSATSLRLGLPMIYGAVERYSGQVSVFDPRRADSPCYRCLFPYPPAAGEAPGCAEAGVLGVLPGVIGLLQATEALKLLLDLGAPLIGRLLLFDALAMRFRELALPRDPQCPGCGADAQPLDAQALQHLCQS
jgi:molybdopterin/thiamine biosynthesis adenylyltransferase